MSFGNDNDQSYDFKPMPREVNFGEQKPWSANIEINFDRLAQLAGSAWANESLRQMGAAQLIPKPVHPQLDNAISPYQQTNTAYRDLLDVRQKRQFKQVAKVAREHGFDGDLKTSLNAPQRPSWAANLAKTETSALDRYSRFELERASVIGDAQRLGGGLGFLSPQDAIAPSLVSPSEFRGANREIAQTYLRQTNAFNCELGTALKAQDQLAKTWYRATLGTMGAALGADYLLDHTVFEKVVPSWRTTAIDLIVPLVSLDPRLNLIAKGLTMIGGHALAMAWDKWDATRHEGRL
ncbi:MAG TPA: hypothetical protein V6D22_04375 [Candidatus Obscuribacterales bacterium]